MTVTTAQKPEKQDIIIIGGGLTGLTAAIGAAKLGLKTAVIDRQSLCETITPTFDGRASALAFATTRMLDSMGIWQHMEKHAQPILEIRVSDGPIRCPSPCFLHFDHACLGDGPLGHMVENRHTRTALQKTMADLKGIRLYAPARVTAIQRDTDSASVTLDTGETLSASLIVAADGRMSDTRKTAGIRTTEWGYNQSGIVLAIEHEISHQGIAHERFLPSGPFAILPLTDNRASLVWTEKTHLVPTIMALSERAFQAEVQRRIGDFLGQVTPLAGRWSYPLALTFADRYTDTRLALIGDAAHAVHPIAGQGLNMGLRDVAALLDILEARTRTGLDIGTAETLDAYEQWRTFDNATLMGVTDILNRLFSNHSRTLGHMRDAGLAVVNKIPPLKSFFMQHARGTVGSLPRLLHGKSLW